LHNKTPIISGWVAGDGSFLGETNLTVNEYKKEAEAKYGNRYETFLSIFPAATAEEVKLVKQKLTLLSFAGLPAHLLAGFSSKPSYIYQFTHVPPDKAGFPNYGAFHTSDVPYALHTLHTWDRPWQQLDKDLEEMISSYWANFAKTGDPNGGGLPEWKSYSKVSGNIMQFGDKVEVKPALLKKELDFLEANY
jgi:para-nitrobenzyl esterase